MKNMILPEDLFREAVIKACEKENDLYDRMIEREPEPEPSGAFRERIMTLYENRKDRETDAAGNSGDSGNPGHSGHPGHPAGKISRMSLRVKLILVAVIVMCMGTMTVAGIDRMHERTYKMFEVSYPDHTDITFGEVEGSTEDIEAGDGIRTYDPADFLKRIMWIPDGFQIDAESVEPESCWLTQGFIYTDPQGKWYQIDYEQTAAANSGGTAFTSDGSPGKEIDIGDDRGYLYRDEGGYRTIVMEKDGIIYTIGGNLEADILVRCLESAFGKVTDISGGRSLAENYETGDFSGKPAWVPDGFFLESTEEYPDWTAYTYHKKDTLYDSVRYEQVRIDQSTWKLSDGSNQVDEIMVGDDPAYLITQEDGTFPRVILAKGGIEHRISGDCEVEEMIRCLESAMDTRPGR